MSNEHFNFIAGWYDKASSFIPSERLLHALELPVAGLLLDAGGGTGRVSDALRDLVDRAIVADVSIGMMKYAQKKNLDCVFAPIESLPFASETFERIIMLDAFHHVQDQQRTSAELFRSLRRGGRLVIIEPNINKIGVKLIALIEKLLLMRSRFLTGDRIAAFFTEPDVKINIEYAEANVWIVIEK